MSSPTTPSVAGDQSPQRRPGFRGDIEGLRAVAVVGVLLYHAGVPWFSGGFVGVDVFFVISGFLITGLLFKELAGTGRIRLGRFFARRVKRLLPLALVVLATVTAMSAWLSDPVSRPGVGRDIAASGLYVMNWRLATQSVNYSADRTESSPLQHFWSLGVEEQFYLGWPLLLVAVALCWRLWGGNLRWMLTAAVAAIGAASLAYAEWLTHESANAAYFSTFARGWELALGGLLALALAGDWFAPRPVRRLCGVGGLLAVVWSMFAYGDATLFPGSAALVPTLGVAAIILAGSGGAATAVSRLLESRPMRHVGRLSYSWYLWHWPLLVFAGMAFGSLSALQGLLVVAASYVPTRLTHSWVERPLHHARGRWSRPVRALPAGALASVVAFAMGFGLTTLTPDYRLASPEQSKGAEALHQSVAPIQRSAKALRPEPDKVVTDMSDVFRGCLVRQQSTELKNCELGEPSGDTTVALLGDSHALQYAPALRRVARRQGWRLVVLGKAGCPPAAVDVLNEGLRREYDECRAWHRKAVRRINREQPDLLITSSYTEYDVMEDGEPLDRDRSAHKLQEGYVALLNRLDGARNVAVIAEHPHLGDTPGCVAENTDRLDECALDRERATDFPPVNRKVARRVDKARLIDPMPSFCRDDVCPAVAGNVIIYRGGQHLSATYVRTMAPWFRQQLTDLV